MAVSEAQKKATYKWESKVYDKGHYRMPKGKKAEIAAHVAKTGESANAFVNRAIDETIARDNNTA